MTALRGMVMESTRRKSAAVFPGKSNRAKGYAARKEAPTEMMDVERAMKRELRIHLAVSPVNTRGKFSSVKSLNSTHTDGFALKAEVISQVRGARK